MCILWCGELSFWESLGWRGTAYRCPCHVAARTQHRNVCQWQHNMATYLEWVGTRLLCTRVWLTHTRRAFLLRHFVRACMQGVGRPTCAGLCWAAVTASITTVGCCAPSSNACSRVQGLFTTQHRRAIIHGHSLHALLGCSGFLGH